MESLDKIQRPLLIVLLISVVVLVYLYYSEHQRNNIQDKAIKNLVQYINKQVNSLQYDIDETKTKVDEIELEVKDIESTLNY